MHYSVPSLASALATGQTPESCRRADDDRFHRDEIAISFTQRHESVDHWTRVEAGYIAGACPTRLQSFFASLVRIDHSDIAARISANLKRLGVPS
jgi:hypothetical protein